MPVKNREEIFVRLLSHVRQGTERTATILQELAEVAQNQEIREALQARAFISQKTLATIDEAFKQISQKPVKLSGRLHDVFVEDFRRELSEIQSPEAKLLFILAKAHQLVQLRVAEYVTMIAAADASGYYGVGILLESCLADLLAFTERARRLICHVVEARVAAATAGS
jgi:ferritin-like metal-binding protein YciE